MTGSSETNLLMDVTLNQSDSDLNPPGPLVGPCSHQNSQKADLVVGPYIHSIICILGFMGNSLVIITYAFYKRSKSMTDVYLLNVAIADLLFVVSLPLIVYNEMTSWSMGLVACKVLRGSYSVNLYSGMLLLACISTDRYIAVVLAHRSFRLRSLPYSHLICAIVWITAILLSIPNMYFSDRYQVSDDSEDESFLEEDVLNETSSINSRQYFCEFRFTNYTTAVGIKMAVPSIQLAVGFFLPLLVMTFCYTTVIITLLRVRNFQRHRAVRVVLAVGVVFIICHLPYNVTLLYDTVTMFQLKLCNTSDTVQTAKTVTQIVAYLHCCLNPVLYAFVGVKFRNHFRSIVRDLWCLRKRYINPRRFFRVTSEIYVSNRRSVDGSSDKGNLTWTPKSSEPYEHWI